MGHPPGNSSQVSDGAAAVLIGRRSAVEARGLPVMGVLRAGAVVGVPPDVMGIGPAVAIPAALQKAGEPFLPFLPHCCWLPKCLRPLWNKTPSFIQHLLNYHRIVQRMKIIEDKNKLIIMNSYLHTDI